MVRSTGAYQSTFTPAYNTKYVECTLQTLDYVGHLKVVKKKKVIGGLDRQIPYNFYLHILRRQTKLLEWHHKSLSPSEQHSCQMDGQLSDSVVNNGFTRMNGQFSQPVLDQG